jgi:hypothetical protein
MSIKNGWYPVYRATQILGLSKETLFQYRDDGTLKLGPHYRAFSDTFSRDSYRWNVSAVRQHLREQGLMTDDDSVLCNVAS